MTAAQQAAEKVVQVLKRGAKPNANAGQAIDVALIHLRRAKHQGVDQTEIMSEVRKMVRT